MSVAAMTNCEHLAIPSFIFLGRQASNINLHYYLIKEVDKLSIITEVIHVIKNHVFSENAYIIRKKRNIRYDLNNRGTHSEEKDFIITELIIHQTSTNQYTCYIRMKNCTVLYKSFSNELLVENGNKFWHFQIHLLKTQVPAIDPELRQSLMAGKGNSEN